MSSRSSQQDTSYNKGTSRIGAKSSANRNTSTHGSGGSARPYNPFSKRDNPRGIFPEKREPLKEPILRDDLEDLESLDKNFDRTARIAQNLNAALSSLHEDVNKMVAERTYAIDSLKEDDTHQKQLFVYEFDSFMFKHKKRLGMWAKIFPLLHEKVRELNDPCEGDYLK